MINLLPSEIKEDIYYARRNTKIRSWIIACFAAMVGLAIIVVGGLIYMQQSITKHTSQLAEAQQILQTQKVSETEKRVEEISNSTKLAVQVLSREVLFSKMLRQIGAALPADSVLQELEIEKAQGGVTLNAAAGNFGSATQVQLNLQDEKNGVFEKADINDITCSDPNAPAAESASRYPCEITLRALFNKDNPYLYIAPNNSQGAKP